MTFARDPKYKSTYLFLHTSLTHSLVLNWIDSTRSKKLTASFTTIGIDCVWYRRVSHKLLQIERNRWYDANFGKYEDMNENVFRPNRIFKSDLTKKSCLTWRIPRICKRTSKDVRHVLDPSGQLESQWNYQNGVCFSNKISLPALNR